MTVVDILSGLIGKTYNMPEEQEPLNFNYRFNVETNMGKDGIIDHRDPKESFYTREYKRNMQEELPVVPPTGFAPMRSVTQPPKPKAGTKQRRTKKPTDETQDAALKKAARKDLTDRGL